jgi:small subunit ribosomal protein S3Ae
MSKQSKKSPLLIYNVHADSVFKDKVITQILGREPEKILKRTVETTLADLTEDFSNLYYQYIKIKLQIVRIDGQEAYSKFKGHEITRDYIRSLIRVGTSKVDVFYDLITSDNIHCKIQTLVITAKRISHSKQTEIRKKVIEMYDEKLKNISLDDLVQYMLFGKMAADVLQAAKKIYPIKKVEIMKSKILTPYF